MHRHPSADVDIHSTEEPQEVVGARLTGRSQLQWWPLSSVELLTLDSGVAEAEAVLGRLTKLIETAQFRLVSREDVSFARDWALGPGIRELAESSSRLTHGDMKFSHVFPGPCGFRFVDRSVPLRGPAGIDLVQLLEDQNIDPLGHADPDLVTLRWFLFLRWAIEAKTRLLPAIPTMFDEWAATGVARMRAARRMRTLSAGHGRGPRR